MQQRQPSPGRLTRDTEHQMLGGVCAGIARRYGYDVTVVRVGAVLLTLVWGAGLLVYVALWILMPAAPLASTGTTGAAGAGEGQPGGAIPRAPLVSDDLADRARRAAEDLAIAARSAAEAARVAADQLGEVARVATTAGREAWEQQRAARAAGSTSTATSPTTTEVPPGAPPPPETPPPPFEAAPPPGPDDVRPE